MKGHVEVIKHLNVILTNELTAINQYFLHARMCQAWGFEKIGGKIYKESIDEMKHAQSLIDRILFLEGVPNLQKLGTLNIGETVPEQLKSDLQMELSGHKDLKVAVKVCVDAEDHASRELLESIIASEEEHIDWLEAQLEIIQKIGVENYLAQQIS